MKTRLLAAIGVSMLCVRADAQVPATFKSERELLGESSIGFISFLESSGVLAPSMREMVLDRAKAAGVAPVDLEHLKVIVLMVFWSVGEEPDALILDELSIGGDHRSIH